MAISMKEPSGITNDAAHVDCYHEIDPQALVDVSVGDAVSCAHCGETVATLEYQVDAVQS